MYNAVFTVLCRIWAVVGCMVLSTAATALIVAAVARLTGNRLYIAICERYRPRPELYDQDKDQTFREGGNVRKERG